MLFDELKCYNTVSFKLRSLKWGVEYCFSHSSHIYFKMLLAYYCDTQKQSSGEFAKFTGKQLCRSPFLNKAAGGRPIKKEAPKGLRPAALSKRDSITGVFPWILRDFLEYVFCIWLSYRMIHEIGVLKNLAEFTAKFMWTAASGISENRPCLAGCKFIE